MVSLDPNTDFENWNEVMAERYDPDHYHHHPNLIVRTIEGWRTRKVLRYLNVKAGERVVDLGCGAGNMLEMLPKDSERWGVDLSTFLLDKASKRLGVPWKDPNSGEKTDSNQAVHLIRGNLQCLPSQIKAEGLFDKALCSEVIEHLPDPELALSQACTLLRPGATFVISVPDERRIDQIKGALKKIRLLHRIFPDLPEKMEDEWHLHCFDLPSLRKIVSALPLKEVRCAAIPSRIMPLRWVVAYEKKPE
jgi:2-polyprenyl-3-methyl-5-hydroxy-6-metoxy-1,4-benzoquinol methylase